MERRRTILVFAIGMVVGGLITAVGVLEPIASAGEAGDGIAPSISNPTQDSMGPGPLDATEPRGTYYPATERSRTSRSKYIGSRPAPDTA